MKKTITILTILAFIASSCRQATKEPAEVTNIEQDEKEILVGKIRIDTFEILDYFDDLEYFDHFDLLGEPFFIVKKDNQIIQLFDDRPIGETRTFNRGDVVEIQWKNKLDISALFETEWAVNVKKIEDGKLSVFRKTNKPRSYIFMENDRPKWYQTMLINDVEYFLANTTDKNMLQYLNDGKGDIQIYISEYWKKEAEYPIVAARIDNYDGNKNHTLIRLGIEYDNYERIYSQFDEEKKEYIRIE